VPIMKRSFNARTCNGPGMTGRSTVRARTGPVMISDGAFVIMTGGSLFMPVAALNITVTCLELNGTSHMRRSTAHGMTGAMRTQQVTVLITQGQIMKTTGPSLDMNDPVTTRNVTSLILPVKAIYASGPPRVLDGTFLFIRGAVQMRTGTPRVRTFTSLGLTFTSLVLTDKFTLLTVHFLSLPDQRRHFHHGDLDEHPSR
jgi:hypothetical protein